MERWWKEFSSVLASGGVLREGWNGVSFSIEEDR